MQDTVLADDGVDGRRFAVSRDSTKHENVQRLGSILRGGLHGGDERSAVLVAELRVGRV